ncbi:hypothetical protein DPMN_122014 [Dreissena polymorpha]|uniref:Uncharacterized protein n=1 Tax=Dreissena polymorpha TaxID=45954 RepID=A0A9D4GNU9_DREPO|nr:hypothetical protein DPMN_122014 [Dreissena polymorpha]
MARQRTTRLVMGPCILEIDRIVIRDILYQFEVNGCRNEEFQGSRSNSVGGDNGGDNVFQGSLTRTDGQTDGQTPELTTISPRFIKKNYYTYIFRQEITTFAHLKGAKNVISKYKKTAPGSYVIQLTGTIFKLNSHIKETNVLTKFHENWTKNVTSKVENTLPTGGHVFPLILTIFELVRDINKTNVLTNCPDDWANFPNKENCPPPGSNVIQLTGTIFEINSHIKKTNVLTNFLVNWEKNMTFRVFTCFHYIHIEKNAPSTGGHVFFTADSPCRILAIKSGQKKKPAPIWTIFELVRDINKTNVLTNFHDDWAKIVTSIDHVFQLTGTIFKLNSHIKETNVLTKFHENWTKNVTFSVSTCFHYIHIEKNAPPTGSHVFFTNLDHFRTLFTRKTAPPTDGHVFQQTGTTFEHNQHIIKANILTHFELVQDITGTNLMTKFHEDRK